MHGTGAAFSAADDFGSLQKAQCKPNLGSQSNDAGNEDFGEFGLVQQDRRPEAVGQMLRILIIAKRHRQKTRFTVQVAADPLRGELPLVGHVQVHKHDMGVQLLCHLNGLAEAGGLADHLNGGIGGEQLTNAAADDL